MHLAKVAIICLGLISSAIANPAQNAEDKHRRENPASLVAAIVVRRSESTIPQQQSQEHQPNGQPPSVRVVSLPPRDWIDRCLAILNGIWVCVGIAGVVVAARSLVVIERQTAATEKSAAASVHQLDLTRKTLMYQFRPKIKIRGLHYVDTDEFYGVEIILANHGDTVAQVTEATVKLSLLWSLHGQDEISTTVHQAFSVTPGDDGIMRIGLEENRTLLNMTSDEETRPIPLRCEGIIKYSDANGISRRTAFQRDYTKKSSRFTPTDDKEYEYED